MPLKGFEWLSEEELASFDPMRDISASENMPGYFLEVTLRYPKHLHLAHNSFPLAPENMEIQENDLSPHAKKCLDQLNYQEFGLQRNRPKHTSRKLTSTFKDRKEYFLHGLNLKLYLEEGLELVAIHRGIKFEQKRFIAPYIEERMKKRQLSKTKVQSNLEKMLCNSLFGKFIEGVDKRVDCKFNLEKTKAQNKIRDPLLKGVCIIDENFSISFHKKKRLRLRQSWAVGFTILELSKYFMQKVWYRNIRPAFNGKVATLMSDTDSWAMLFRGKSPDEAVKDLEDIMDFSNYPPSHKLFSSEKKNVIGYLKNECPANNIIKFVGVRSKTYAFVTESLLEEKRHKGVKFSAAQLLRYQDYRDVISKPLIKKVVQYSMNAQNHINRIVSTEKIAFSSFDDKRYLLCAKHSCPYGSWLISYQEKNNGVCMFCKYPDMIL